MDYSKAIPFDSTVKQASLKMATYYIKKNAKPEKKVDLRLVVNAGSILEPTTNKDWRIYGAHVF
jgi:zinc protease